MIPADLRILNAKDLFISQSALTGESEPVEKAAAPVEEALASDRGALPGLPGKHCHQRQRPGGGRGGGQPAPCSEPFARTMSDKPPKTAFDKGIGSVSKLLIRFMAVMVPVVLFLNGFTKGNWMEAVLFAISVAVGLTHPRCCP